MAGGIAALWREEMRSGNFEGAWRISDRVLAVRKELPAGKEPLLTQPCLWRGENLRGKNVLICCNHGLGDSIHFVRYAAMVRQCARRVMMKTQPELIGLF